MTSKSRISMISVFNLCLTISRQIASRSWLFLIPIRCNALSFKRSSALPVISCCIQIKKQKTILLKSLKFIEMVSIYLLVEIAQYIDDILRNVFDTIFEHQQQSISSLVLVEMFLSKLEWKNTSNYFRNRIAVVVFFSKYERLTDSFSASNCINGISQQIS